SPLLFLLPLLCCPSSMCGAAWSRSSDLCKLVRHNPIRDEEIAESDLGWGVWKAGGDPRHHHRTWLVDADGILDASRSVVRPHPVEVEQGDPVSPETAPALDIAEDALRFLAHITEQPSHLARLVLKGSDNEEINRHQPSLYNSIAQQPREVAKVVDDVIDHCLELRVRAVADRNRSNLRDRHVVETIADEDPIPLPEPVLP